MFEVRDDNGNIVAVTTRREDAEVYVKTSLDKTQYTIKKVLTFDANHVTHIM